MLTLFRWLLRLYPASFSREFSEEMTSVFDQGLEDVRNQNWKIRGSFLVREFWGAFTGALSERLGCRFDDLFGRFDMSSFRFSRFTMVFMILALLGVGVAIEAAKRLSVTGGVGELVFPSVRILGVFLTIAAFLGGIGYVVLRAFSRPGIERLAKINTWPQERQSPRR